MQKKYFYLIVPAIAAVALGAGAVYADSFGMGRPDNGLVQAIAGKFNLNASEVQKVFDDQMVKMHSEMQARGQQMFAERLKSLVSEGKLTQDQADKITAKKAELQSQMASMQGKTREEIDALRKTHMDSLKQWADDNNIPLEYVIGMGKGMGKGFRQAQ